jgi:hypothetical protein
MIGIFSNGSRTNKSSSLVMMQSALPGRASSRYMSSIESRHTLTVCETATNSTVSCMSTRNSNLVSSATYLSNFSYAKTRLYSANITSEISIEPSAAAFSQHCLAIPLSKIKELMSTLQSKTKFIYLSRSSFISFKISSSISGVSPFFLACSLASFMIFPKLLFLLPTSSSKVCATDFFSAKDICATFSAVGSLTSNVIVFIIFSFNYQIYRNRN